MFQSLCLVRELASKLERSLGIMDVPGVANPCFHPILSGTRLLILISNLASSHLSSTCLYYCV